MSKLHKNHIHCKENPMDDKALTALSTTLALFQIQLNALMDRHIAADTVREGFQRLVSEGVSTVGLETKNRIREGFVE
jgi:hypothetical protein